MWKKSALAWVLLFVVMVGCAQRARDGDEGAGIQEEELESNQAALKKARVLNAGTTISGTEDDPPPGPQPSASPTPNPSSPPIDDGGIPTHNVCRGMAARFGNGLMGSDQSKLSLKLYSAEVAEVPAGKTSPVYQPAGLAWSGSLESNYLSRTRGARRLPVSNASTIPDGTFLISLQFTTTVGGLPGGPIPVAVNSITTSPILVATVAPLFTGTQGDDKTDAWNAGRSSTFIYGRFLGGRLRELRAGVLGTVSNAQTVPIDKMPILLGPQPDTHAISPNPEDCDESLVSPLALDMDSPLSSASLSLSAPFQGVWFNITNFFLPNGAPKLDQISWVTHPRQNPFLALPALVKNERGQLEEKVNGAQELFGDTTIGPDKNRADNGFKALLKYDINGDGLIDARDPVYGQLRLWFDHDRNGKSDPGELVSLSQAGVTSIHARDYIHVFEKDIYGNATLQRSFADTSSGARAVFDVWFHLAR